MASQNATLGSTGAVLVVATGNPASGASGVGAGAVTFNLVPGASVTATLLFEGTTDGANWFQLAAHQLLGSGLLSGPNVFSVTNPTTATQMVVPIYGCTQVRCRMATWGAGTVAVLADLAASAPTGMQYADIEGQKPTYSGQLTAFTPVATATDILVFPGSATKTVKLTRLEMYGVATAAAQIDIALIKRTTADTSGTSAAAPTIAHDLNDPAATSLPLSYSANPTLGSTASGGGTIRAGKLFLGATPAPAGGLGGLIWEFGAGRQGRCPTARGVAQQICLNWGGAAVPAGTVLDIAYELTEE